MRPLFLTAILLLCLTSLVRGQAEDSTVIELDGIVIAENRIQMPYAAQSRSISLVSKQQIQQAPVLSVADMLHHVGGVDVRTRGANGVQADIGIRGGTFDQTLILINGIKISDPQTGHHSMNLPLDMASIERIEVLKGPGARTFGQNAFSGAVNIVTTTPKVSFFKVGVQGGDFGLWGGRASGAWVAEEQSHYLSVSYDQSAGYKHNTDYQIVNAFYYGNLNLKQGALDFMGGFTYRAFGANGFYASPEYTEQYESIVTGLAAITYKTLLTNMSWESRLYYRVNDDEYIFIRDNPEFYQNNHLSQTLGLESNLVIPFKNATTGLGIDLNQVSLRSTNLGNHERTVASVFAEHRMEFFDHKLNITPGIQVNYYSDFGFNALPGIDLGYLAGENITLYSSIGYTYRVPTFTDLYYHDPVNIGNPDLDPEYAWNFELGIKSRQMVGFSGQISGFYRAGNNMIDWVRTTATDPWQPVNILFLAMAGLDASGSLNFTQMHGAPAFLDHFTLNYTFIEADTDIPDSGLSRYALENLRHQLRGTLILRYGHHIVHSLSAGYYNRVNLDDYTLVDTRLMYKHDRFDVFMDVTNIFAITYQETNLVTMPGRWFKMGVNIAIF